MNRTIQFHFAENRDLLAADISNQFERWKQVRTQQEALWLEVRNFVFATDTRSTLGTAGMAWKNSTTRPKLTQIRDNLHANYIQALFPNRDWLQWEANSEDAADFEKARIITSYMLHKLEQSKFQEVIAEFLLDWIDYGNCFGEVVYENSPEYQGPRVVRTSPYDIVMDPTASSFHNTPKITRRLYHLGDLLMNAEDYPSLGYQGEVLERIKQDRSDVITYGAGSKSGTIEEHINAAYSVDGYGSLMDYYKSNYVELLEFEGNIYDPRTQEVLRNRKITVVDRAYILRDEELKSRRHHVGWRSRPDNLWAMGPLDNLVGMQYRVDHLENCKADIFDKVANPVVKIRGSVTWNGWGPDSIAYVGDDGDIDLLHPDPRALQIDLQIRELEQAMEEYAGAPREAMGIRTPGEKTAFEVSSLQNAASRIFQTKIAYFEAMFLEPIIQDMFDLIIQNFSIRENIRVFSEDLGAVTFQDVTADDINIKGKFKPKAARHFAEQAKLVQELTNFLSIARADPGMAVHISGVRATQAFESILKLDNYGIVTPYVALSEQREAQSLAQQHEEGMMVDAMTPVEEEF